MSVQDKIEEYFSSARHDLRSQLVVVREGTSMILEGIGNTDCKNCFSLLKPALESTDELNKLIGEILSTSRVNAILGPLLSAIEEEMKSVKKQLLSREEELRSIKKELLEKDEELLRKEEDLTDAKEQLLGKEEEVKNVKKELLAKDGELKTAKKELLAKKEEVKPAQKELQGNEMEVMKYELMGMISHVIRTPLAVIKESVALTLDEIPGKLNPQQKELLSTGKRNIDILIKSIEEVFKESWDEVVKSAGEKFSTEGIVQKDRLAPKKRILIVEDQAVIVNMLKIRLQANNYEVITAGDGEEGLEKAKKEKPNLIILDVMLPRMNGYKVCQLLKADPKYNTIPIILASGRTPQEIRKVGEEVGANAYVSKPFEAEELLSKMKELLDERGK